MFSCRILDAKYLPQGFEPPVISTPLLKILYNEHRMDTKNNSSYHSCRMQQIRRTFIIQLIRKMANGSFLFWFARWRSVHMFLFLFLRIDPFSLFDSVRQTVVFRRRRSSLSTSDSTNNANNRQCHQNGGNHRNYHVDGDQLVSVSVLVLTGRLHRFALRSGRDGILPGFDETFAVRDF